LSLAHTDTRDDPEVMRQCLWLSKFT